MTSWLRAVAPSLAQGLDGPLAGVAAVFAAEQLGLSDKSAVTLRLLLRAGIQTPAQIASLRAADEQFSKFLRQHHIDLAKLSKKEEAQVRRTRTQDTLAVIVVLGFFGILTAMLLGLLRVSDQQALLILLGSLSAGFGAVLNFFFGSSRSSQSKDELLAGSMPALPPTSPERRARP